MTAEERRLTHGLIIRPPSGTRPVSTEEFARRFPSALKDGKLALRLLQEARQVRNPEDLQCAIIIGNVFGFSAEHHPNLCRLIKEDWHFSHEEIVSALHKIGLKDRDTVCALYEATQIVPGYLEYDDNRALAVKAIWALGEIANEAADEKLRYLAESHEPILRMEALQQLRRHQFDGP
jgi:hypothetical protein